VLFHIGPVPVTAPVVTTWSIMLVLALTSRYLTRRLAATPGRAQVLVEVLVSGIQQQIEQIIGPNARRYLPLLGTLFIFLVASNLCDLLPGVQAPTGKPETPAALALVVFFAVQYYGVRTRGIRGYLSSFAEPKVIMLPLNLLSQITRTFSLMVRLFGNVMSGGFIIALLVALVGLFVPIPLMALEMLIGLVQAYIFAVLATVFIGAAVDSGEAG
jgi:F-type H+-transporting ATPase subunit a